MTSSAMFWVVVMSFFFYVCGGLCVIKPNILVDWAQRNYTKSKFVQAYLFAGMVMKPWYRTYIRGAGIFIWLWALGIDYLALLRGFR